MRSHTDYKTPAITLLIIALNAVIFFVSVTGPPIKDGSTGACLQNNYPQCLELATENPDWECGMRAIQDGRDPQQCLTKLSADCQRNFSEIENCFSPITRTAYQYGHIPTITGIENFFRMISSMFVHASWGHLVGNMAILFLTGIFLEVRLGKLRYLALYLLSGIGASLLHTLMHPEALGPAVGASGAVFGIFGAMLVMKFYDPDRPVLPRIKNMTFDEVFPAHYFILVFIITIISLIFNPDTGIGYAAHLGGFITGFILVFFLMKDDETYEPMPD